MAHPVLRLFCFPHAGGSASAYRAWSRLAADRIEVCPVQLPGRETRFGEPLVTHLESLLAGLAEALFPELDRPYALFGHSIGALIALAAARRVAGAGFPKPRLLVASAHRAPHLAPPEPPRHLLPDRALLEELTRLDGVPGPLLEDGEAMKLVLGVYRADLQLTAGPAWSVDEPIACPIAAYGGEQDPDVPPGDLEAWRPWTSAAFRVRLFPGGHFYLRTAAEAVQAALAADLLESAATEAMGARA